MDKWGRAAMKRGGVDDARYRFCCPYIWRPEFMYYFLRCRWEPGHRGDHVSVDKANGLHRTAQVEWDRPEPPVGTVVLDSEGTAWQRVGGLDRWQDTVDGVHRTWQALCLLIPRVIWTPKDDE